MAETKEQPARWCRHGHIVEGVRQRGNKTGPYCRVCNLMAWHRWRQTHRRRTVAEVRHG